MRLGRRRTGSEPLKMAKTPSAGHSTQWYLLGKLSQGLLGRFIILSWPAECWSIYTGNERHMPRDLTLHSWPAPWPAPWPRVFVSGRQRA